MTPYYRTPPASPPSPSNYDQNSMNSQPGSKERAPKLTNVSVPGTEYESATGQVLPHYGYLSGVSPRVAGTVQAPNFSDNLSRYTNLFQQELQANQASRGSASTHGFEIAAGRMPRTLRGGDQELVRIGWRQKRSKKWWIVVAVCSVLVTLVIILPVVFVVGKHTKGDRHGDWTYPYPVDASSSVSTGQATSSDGASATTKNGLGSETSSSTLLVSNSMSLITERSSTQRPSASRTGSSSGPTSQMLSSETSLFSTLISSPRSSSSFRSDASMTTVHRTITSTLQTTTTTTLPNNQASAAMSSEVSEARSTGQDGLFDRASKVDTSSSASISYISRLPVSSAHVATTTSEPTSASSQGGDSASSTDTDSMTTIPTTSYVESTTMLYSSTVSVQISTSNIGLSPSRYSAAVGGQVTSGRSSSKTTELRTTDTSSILSASTTKDQGVSLTAASTITSSRGGGQAFPFAKWHGISNTTGSPGGWSHGPPAGWRGGPL